MKLVFERVIPTEVDHVGDGLRSEDGGAYRGVEIGSEYCKASAGGQVGITIGSYDDMFATGVRSHPDHEVFNKLVGKRVRITIEVVD